MKYVYAVTDFLEIIPRPTFIKAMFWRLDSVSTLRQKAYSAGPSW